MYCLRYCYVQGSSPSASCAFNFLLTLQGGTLCSRPRQSIIVDIVAPSTKRCNHCQPPITLRCCTVTAGTLLDEQRTDHRSQVTFKKATHHNLSSSFPPLAMISHSSRPLIGRNSPPACPYLANRRWHLVATAVWRLSLAIQVPQPGHQRKCLQPRILYKRPTLWTFYRIQAVHSPRMLLLLLSEQ